MHDGTPSIHGRWRTADPSLDPAAAPTPTQTQAIPTTPATTSVFMPSTWRCGRVAQHAAKCDV